MRTPLRRVIVLLLVVLVLSGVGGEWGIVEVSLYERSGEVCRDGETLVVYWVGCW